MATKADDRYVASLCYRCHSMIDQGSQLPEHARRAIWLAAHTKTIDLLMSTGMWPPGLEMPQ
jgi:hypothetical protein